MLMLNVDQQTRLIAEHPRQFEPHPSKWGAKGATIMHLARTSEKLFRAALAIARANAGPRAKS